MNLFRICLVFVIFGVSFVSNAAPLGLQQEHCVQYHTRKTMFLFKKEEVWGSNCSVTAELQKEGTAAALKITIPIEKFDSGNSSRDEDVKNILKYAEHPMMTFVMDKMEIEEMKKMVSSAGESTIPGQLKIGGVSHPVQFKVKVQKDGGGAQYWISGKMETTFTHFQIQPPKVGGGLVAKTDDWLELEVALPGAKLPQIW